MGIASFLIGLLASLISCTLMLPTIFPLLGWISWIPLFISLPLALFGIVFACIAIFKKDGKGKAWGWIGLILNVGSLLFPILRLVIGGGWV